MWYLINNKFNADKKNRVTMCLIEENMYGVTDWSVIKSRSAEKV